MPSRLTWATLGAAAIAATPAGAPALARAAPVSSNWGGYVASARRGAGPGRFHRVAGSWIQPAVNCPPGQPGYSAFWIGLGGYRQTSRALEQVGTEADCTGQGRAAYSVWYELVPSAPVTLPMRLRAGDRIAGAFTASGRRVTVAIDDLTSGRSFKTVRTASLIDVSSAEWIAEAPSDCRGASRCQQLPLADFGTVAFGAASAATADGHRGPIRDARWTARAVEMRDDGGGSAAGRLAAGARAADALPQALSAAASGFSIRWQAATLADQPPSELPPPPTAARAPGRPVIAGGQVLRPTYRRVR